MMKLDEMIVRLITNEIKKSPRPVKRNFNKGLSSAKWLVAYPCKHIGKSKNEYEFDLIQFVFSNMNPTFVKCGTLGGVGRFSWDEEDTHYQCTFPEIAVHMNGTIWIETSRISPSYIEPISFDDLKNCKVLGFAENNNLHEAITSYMGISENWEIYHIIENYLDSLPPEVLSLKIIFDDVEQRNYYEYGYRTVAIYYKEEIIGYAQFSGRELLYKNFVTTDIKKYQAAMNDIVVNSRVYDKMAYNGVTVVTTGDADIYVGVPGFTPLCYT